MRRNNFKEEDTTTSEASPTDEFIINRMRNSIHSFGSNSNLVLAASNMLNCAVDTTATTNDNSLNNDDERSGGLYSDDDFFDNRQQQQSQQSFSGISSTNPSATDIESPAINNNNTNTTVAAIRSPSSLANTPRAARSNRSATQSTSHIMSLNDIESNNNNNIIISPKPQSIISPLANPSFPISVDDPVSPRSRSFASVAPSVASTKTWDDHYAENNNIIDGDRSNDHITWNNFNNNTNKSDGLLYEENGIMEGDITKGRRKKRKIICIVLVLVCLGAISAGGVALHQALTNNGNSSNDSNANLVSETEDKGSGVIGQDGENEVLIYAPTFYPTITEDDDNDENEDGSSTSAITNAPIQSPTNGNGNSDQAEDNTIWTTEDQEEPNNTSPTQEESSPSSNVNGESGVTIWTGTETDTINGSGAAETPNNNEEVVSSPFPLDTQEEEEEEAGNGQQQQDESVPSPSTATPGVGFGVTIEDILTPSPVGSAPVPPPPPQPPTEPNESSGNTANNLPPPSPPPVVTTTSNPTQRITNSPVINTITTSNPTTKNPTPKPTPPPSIPVNNNLDTLDTVIASGQALSYKDAFIQSGTQTLNIQLKTDQYGEETSWTLYKVDIDTNMETDMIESVEENSYEANEQVNLDISLTPGKYRFTLRDQFGDGFCCSNGSDGWYRVYLDNEEIFRGGWYRQEISHDILVGFDWESTMNERDQEWLVAHNIRREDWHQRNNGLPGYVPLKWSTELAKDAQSWADELLNDCDQEGIAHESDVEEGENLAKNFGNKGQWAGLYPPENILKRWVDDEEFWGYPKNAHLTQALWRASRYVGCGDSIRINSEGVTCRMQVCRYVRAGNCAMGSFQAKEGDNWMVPMFETHSQCGPRCPREGCF